MYIEDLTTIAAIHIPTINKWDKSIFNSFCDQVYKKIGFSEKQKNLVLKLLKKYSQQLSDYTQKDILLDIENPTFRYSIRQLNYNKSISVVPTDDNFKLIRVEFPYNEDLVNFIKSNRQKIQNAHWNADEKAWFFDLTESSILFLMELLNKEQFNLDSQIENYILQTKKITENIEHYVPMLCYDNGSYVYKNVNENLPLNTKKTILEAVFEARKRGISIWDDHISNYINSNDVNSLTREFLKSNFSHHTIVNSEIYNFDDLKDIIINLSPTIFIIPGGDELNNINTVYQTLKNIGINNNEISVMFRLPSELNNNFNEFVKVNQLNSPLTEKTKAVIISTKLPKPVIKSKIKFHSIINLGHKNVHYTMKDFVVKHENLLYFYNKTNQSEFNFGIV